MWYSWGLQKQASLRQTISSFCLCHLLQYRKLHTFTHKIHKTILCILTGIFFLKARKIARKSFRIGSAHMHVGGKNWHESGEALGECNMNIVVFRKGDSRQQKIKWMNQLAWKKLYKKKRHTRTATKLKMTRKKIDIHLIPSEVCSVHEKLDHVSEEELKKEYKTNGEAKWNQHRERVLANRRYSPSHKKMENNIRKHIRSNVPSESWLFRFCIRLGFF